MHENVGSGIFDGDWKPKPFHKESMVVIFIRYLNYTEQHGRRTMFRVEMCGFIAFGVRQLCLINYRL